MPKQQHLIISLCSYVVVVFLLWMKPEWMLVMILLLVLLIIKDIMVYALQMQPIMLETVDLSLVNTHYTKKKISATYFLALLNRIYLFPLLLTIYLLYLLVQQTQLWDMHLWAGFVFTSPQVLLTLTVISGIFLVYKEQDDMKYKNTTTSLMASYGYLALSCVLALLTTYLIYEQTSKLGNISLPISVISGVLIFLVGVLLMEEVK